MCFAYYLAVWYHCIIFFYTHGDSQTTLFPCVIFYDFANVCNGFVTIFKVVLLVLLCKLIFFHKMNGVSKIYQNLP